MPFKSTFKFLLKEHIEIRSVSSYIFNNYIHLNSVNPLKKSYTCMQKRHNLEQSVTVNEHMNFNQKKFFTPLISHLCNMEVLKGTTHQISRKHTTGCLSLRQRKLHMLRFMVVLAYQGLLSYYVLGFGYFQ